MARVDAALVIGADGKQSEVARLVEAPFYRTGRHAAPVVYGHFHGLAEDRYHWYFRKGGSVGVIPSSGGQCCVFVSVQDRNADLLNDATTGFHRALEQIAPDFHRRLAGAAPQKGFRTFRGILRSCVNPRVTAGLWSATQATSRTRAPRTA
jgi:2-polyprenyl-6-methoxyphenol hydroxylase-like FAD-dependent oxidoreductase